MKLHNIKIFIFVICILSIGMNYVSYSQYESLNQTKDTLINNDIPSLRFGVFYSPLRFYSFGNDEISKTCWAPGNMSYNVDYVFNNYSFLSLNFGFLIEATLSDYYEANYHYSDSHLYYVDLSYFIQKEFFHLGLGLGYSYFDYYEEYEYPDDPPYSDYEYFYLNHKNSSLDFSLRFGAELFGTINLDLRYSIGLLNLKDQEVNFSRRSIFGLVLGIKLPSFDSFNKYKQIKYLDGKIRKSI